MFTEVLGQGHFAFLDGPDGLPDVAKNFQLNVRIVGFHEVWHAFGLCRNDKC